MMACEILQTVHTKSPVAIGPQGTSTFVHIALQFTQALSVHGRGRSPHSSRAPLQSPAAVAAFPACRNNEVLPHTLPFRSRRRGAGALLPPYHTAERCGSTESAPDTSRLDRQRSFLRDSAPSSCRVQRVRERIRCSALRHDRPPAERLEQPAINAPVSRTRAPGAVRPSAGQNQKNSPVRRQRRACQEPAHPEAFSIEKRRL